MADSSGSAGRRRVLVVDDNSMNRKVTRALVEEMGHEPILAEDGFQALAALARDPFDIVLMDIEMPRMNGLDTTRKLRAGESGELNRRVRVLALTAHVTDEYRRECMDAGMDGFLSKPVRFETLEAAVNGVPLAEAPSDSDLSPDDVIQRFGGRGRILSRVSGTARKVARNQLVSLQQAAAGNDMEKCRLSAHTLAGTFAVFFMDRAMQAAKAVEKAARENDPDRTRGLLPSLAGHVGALMDFIIDNRLDGGLDE